MTLKSLRGADGLRNHKTSEQGRREMERKEEEAKRHRQVMSMSVREECLKAENRAESHSCSCSSDTAAKWRVYTLKTDRQTGQNSLVLWIYRRGIFFYLSFLLTHPTYKYITFWIYIAWSKLLFTRLKKWIPITSATLHQISVNALQNKISNDTWEFCEMFQQQWDGRTWNLVQTVMSHAFSYTLCFVPCANIKY